jgi:hypothetical protein
LARVDIRRFAREDGPAMAAIESHLPQSNAGRLLRYRLVIPVAALLVFAAFATLWDMRYYSTFWDILQLLGIKSWTFPFLDTHAVLAAAECQRQGVNVYLENPCDFLARPHVYSPLWLSLIPSFLNAADTARVGLALDLLFILSLGLVFRPRSWGEIAIFSLAVFSPITLFAVERGNNDVALFVLLVCASLLWSGAYRSRVAAYALYLLAGLLKFYPLVLLILVGRERWRRAFALALFAALSLLLLIVGYHGEIAAAVSNITKSPYFTDAFSAQNLPYGMVAVLWGEDARSPLALVLLVVLTAAAITRTWRTMGLLSSQEIDWTIWEMRILAIASILLPACFFAGQNISYRGIFILLALPGLVQLRRSLADPAIRRWMTQMIAACLLIMWAEFFRHIYNNAAGLPSPDFANSPLAVTLWVMIWIGRELVWWWLVAGFMALAAWFVFSLPLTRDLVAQLRLRLAPAR